MKQRPNGIKSALRTGGKSGSVFYQRVGNLGIEKDVSLAGRGKVATRTRGRSKNSKERKALDTFLSTASPTRTQPTLPK